MINLSKVIIGDFKGIGANNINIDFVCRKWNHLWFIAQYKDKYTLVKMKCKNSDVRELKTIIPESEVKILIEKLNLTPIQSPVFKNCITWK